MYYVYFTLGLVKTNWSRFSDTVTKNRDVWLDISSMLAIDPFNYDLGKNPRQKVEQKWQNLQKSYKAHLVEEGGTGKGGDVLDNAPPYFAELHEILGNSIHYIIL